MRPYEHVHAEIPIRTGGTSVAGQVSWWICSLTGLARCCSVGRQRASRTGWNAPLLHRRAQGCLHSRLCSAACVRLVLTKGRLSRPVRHHATSRQRREEGSHLLTSFTTRGRFDRNAHSHTTATRQPSSLSASSTRASRSTVLENFSCQNVAFEEGVVANRQPEWRCQKQP